MQESRLAGSPITSSFYALNSSGAFFLTFVCAFCSLINAMLACDIAILAAQLASNAASLIKKIVREWLSPLVRMKGT